MYGDQRVCADEIDGIRLGKGCPEILCKMLFFKEFKKYYVNVNSDYIFRNIYEFKCAQVAPLQKHKKRVC